MDDADAAANASWHATAVRIPLNEDSWLGINSRPNTTQGEALPRRATAGREAYVTALMPTACTRSSTCTGRGPAR